MEIFYSNCFRLSIRLRAIAQNVVKSPILPDEASRGKLEEKTSSKFSERYRDYIDLGLQFGSRIMKIIKTGKKALLFIMVDDTKNCDDVKQYLENTILY